VPARVIFLYRELLPGKLDGQYNHNGMISTRKILCVNGIGSEQFPAKKNHQGFPGHRPGFNLPVYSGGRNCPAYYLHLLYLDGTEW
jgi:hypothetical protein